MVMMQQRPMGGYMGKMQQRPMGGEMGMMQQRSMGSPTNYKSFLQGSPTQAAPTQSSTAPNPTTI
jgi:hypothetical protein